MKKKNILNILLIMILIISLIIIAVKQLVPQSKATEQIYKTVTIQFTSGDKVGAFASKTYVLEVNEVNGYIILPDKFSTTISIDETSYVKKVDDETYYFSEDDYSYSFTGWKIKDETTLTPMDTVFQPGNHIDASKIMRYDSDGDGIVELEALWGKVIYAQDAYETPYYTDYWILDLETTKTRTATGAWNYKYENEVLTLNDGKDVDNPICSLDYAYYLFYQMDYNNNFENAKSYNAYEYVIMLTGDLDYIKSSNSGKGQTHFFTSYDNYDGTYDGTKNYIFGEYVAQQSGWGYVRYFNSTGTLSATGSDNNARVYTPNITFKSCTTKQTENYNLYLNGFGYFDNTFNSLRIDNVNYVQSPNTTNKRPKKSSPVSVASETAFVGRKNCCLEFTSRATTSKYTFRPNAVQTVVVNGGTLSSWQTSWTSGHNDSNTYNYDISWYMGENAKVNGAVHLGTTAHYETNKTIINQNISFTMTGGQVTNIYGGSRGINSQSIGTRKITIIGDKGTNITTNPKITNIYGAAHEGTLTGETFVTIKGATNITNVYGGGYAFTATTYGNTNINIVNSYISGDVFGGGLNGNVEKDSSGNGGNVNLSISKSVIKGNIYGSGTGGMQTVSTTISITKAQEKTDWQNTKYIPTDSDFTSIKNADNGDYETNWDWSEPATGFPYMQDETQYICTAIYKSLSWTNNNPDHIAFQRNYIYSYLSIAIVENDVNIEISGSEIGTKGDASKGNVYGGGSVAKVGGNTYVTIKGNSVIYGSIHGGGDGASTSTAVDVYYPVTDTYTPPTYTVVRDTNGNITKVQLTNENSSYKQYKYDTKFNWSSEAYLLEQNGVDTENGLLYSENVNGLGVVQGNTNVTVEDSSVEGDIFAGGNAADVKGETNIIITNSTATNVYGGGDLGGIDKNTDITINSGTMENVFGGGNLGVVNGNTKVTVGSEQNLNTNISSLLYGGGRGYDANNDGDASDFTTVYGSSIVKILGTNTNVENYGSVKLGAVAGDVNVTFEDYWTGNATSKYKTMNGIDRATTVTFDNSYVLLENKNDETGELEGIKEIDNLIIPGGSGLKISADGSINNDFTGGGELYLDSKVCLTILGDISGITTLVLNPLWVEGEGANQIAGGIENPYMKVKGNSKVTDTVKTEDIELVSGESRYEIWGKKYEEADGTVYSYYYIESSVTILNYVQVDSISVKDKVYSGEISNEQGIQIATTDDFTSDIKIYYELVEQGDSYKQLTRDFMLKINTSENAIIPKGTEIVMIKNEKYYYYIVPEDCTKIEVTKFKDKNDVAFVEDNSLSTAEGAFKEENEVTGAIAYKYNEEYKFIVKLAKGENQIQPGTYYAMININDNGTWLKEEQTESANTIQIKQRNYNYNCNLDKEKYESNSVINIEGTLDITAIPNVDVEGHIYSVVKLVDSLGTKVTLPEGTVIKANNIEYEMQNGKSFVKIIENITNAETSGMELDITIDMSNVLLQNRLDAGEYKIILEFVQVQDELQRGIIYYTKQLATTIIDYNSGNAEDDNFGVLAEIQNTDELADSKLQFITMGNEETRKIKLTYNGELIEPKVKITVLEKTGNFEYTISNNSKKIEIENYTVTNGSLETELFEEQNFNVRFTTNINEGTYRIKFEVYDKYGTKKTEDFVNFVVAENSN